MNCWPLKVMLFCQVVVAHVGRAEVAAQAAALVEQRTDALGIGVRDGEEGQRAVPDRCIHQRPAFRRQVGVAERVGAVGGTERVALGERDGGGFRRIARHGDAGDIAVLTVSTVSSRVAVVAALERTHDRQGRGEQRCRDAAATSRIFALMVCLLGLGTD